MTTVRDHQRTTEYAPWVDPLGKENDWGTSHLPIEVVEQPFLLAVEMTTVEGSPREGGVWASLRISGRDNPALSEDEIEYITTVVASSLRGLKDGKPAPA